MPLTFLHGPAGAGKRQFLLSQIAQTYPDVTPTPAFRWIVPDAAHVENAPLEFIQTQNKSGVFWSQNVLTWDLFLLELLKVNAPRIHKSTASLERHAIRLALLENKDPKLTPIRELPGFIEPLRQFFLKLKLSGKPLSVFSEKKTPISDAVLKLFESSASHLRKINHWDRGDLAWEVLQRLEEKSLKLPQNLTHLYIDRIFPLGVGMREILRALLRNFPNLQITIAYSFDYQSSEDSWLYPAYLELGQLAEQTQHFTKKQPNRTPAFLYSHPISEVDATVEKIKTDLSSGAQKIAACLPQAGNHLALLCQKLTAHQIPFSCGFSQPLLEKNSELSPVISAFHEDLRLKLALQSEEARTDFETQWMFESNLLLKDVSPTVRENWKIQERKLLTLPKTSGEGVQILPLAQAASQDWDCVHLLDFSQGHYPSINPAFPLIPAQLLYDPILRELLETPVYQFTVGLENLKALTQRAKSLTISASQNDWQGREQLPGRSISNLEWKAIPSSHSPTLSIPQETYPSAHHATYSFSSLETYGKCPHQYYHRFVLGLGRPETEDLDPRPDTVGQIIHGVLDRLYQEESSLYRDSLEFEVYFKRLCERMHKILGEVAKASVDLAKFPVALQKSFIERAERAITQWLNQERQWFLEKKKTTIPQHFEWQFGRGKTPPIPLKINDKTYGLTGRIDRIDVDKNQKAFSVIDYKTGTLSSSKGIREGEFLQIPLYLWAVSELLYPNFTPASGFLAGLKEIKISGITFKDGPEEKLIRGGAIDASQWDALLQTMKQKISEWILKIEAGEFAPNPADSTLCDRCDYRAVCHYQG